MLNPRNLLRRQFRPTLLSAALPAERVAKLRRQSFETEPSISVERALLVTEFYEENYGRYSYSVLRALNFKNLCEKKTIYIGEDELIVGERGPFPRAVRGHRRPRR